MAQTARFGSFLRRQQLCGTVGEGALKMINLARLFWMASCQSGEEFDRMHSTCGKGLKNILEEKTPLD